MKNVNLHVAAGVVPKIHSMRGRPCGPRSRSPCSTTATVRDEIDEGEIAMSTASLTTLMNQYVFNTARRPSRTRRSPPTEGRAEAGGVLDRVSTSPSRSRLSMPTPDGAYGI
jgi:hypothetical protein